MSKQQQRTGKNTICNVASFSTAPLGAIVRVAARLQTTPCVLAAPFERANRALGVPSGLMKRQAPGRQNRSRGNNVQHGLDFAHHQWQPRVERITVHICSGRERPIGPPPHVRWRFQWQRGNSLGRATSSRIRDRRRQSPALMYLA